LALFSGNPFAGEPPRQVRAVLWQYWFTSIPQKRATGDWWSRRLLGLYAPVLARDAMGKVGIVAMPDALPAHD
jgi:beta-glucosidase-like glycosyl hydrolase